MAKRSSFISLALLVVGACSAVEALRLGLGSVRHPGVGFLPFLVGCSLGVTACFSLAAEIAAARKARTEERIFGPFVMRVGTVILSLIFFVAILPTAGYLLSTFLLFAMLFKSGGIQRWTWIVLASLVTTFTSWFVFGYCLSIRFPKGFLGL